MSRRFPNQLDAHTVTGYWSPTTRSEKISWFIWKSIGLIGIAGIYPIIVFGYIIKSMGSIGSSVVQTIGVKTTGFIILLGWIGTGVVVSPDLTIGIVAGSSFGLLCLTLSYIGLRLGLKSIFYPSIMNSLLVPPAILAFFSELVNDIVFPYSNEIAIIILESIFEPLGYRSYINEMFSLEGFGLIIFWILASVLIGWILAIVATTAEWLSNRQEGLYIELAND